MSTRASASQQLRRKREREQPQRFRQALQGLAVHCNHLTSEEMTQRTLDLLCNYLKKQPRGTIETLSVLDKPFTADDLSKASLNILIEETLRILPEFTRTPAGEWRLLDHKRTLPLVQKSRAGRPRQGQFFQCPGCGEPVYRRPSQLKESKEGALCSKCARKLFVPPIPTGGGERLKSGIVIGRSRCPKCGSRTLDYDEDGDLECFDCSFLISKPHPVGVL